MDAPFVLFILDAGPGRYISTGSPKLWSSRRVVFTDRDLLRQLPLDEIKKRLASSEDAEEILVDLEHRLLALAEDAKSA